MGRHARSAWQARRTAIAVGVVVVIGGVILASGILGPSVDEVLVRPERPCGRPPLRTVEGVTLQAAPMAAYRRAQRATNGAIEVVQSYRSCREQREACTNICGNPQGCPGTCARPGTSYHQLGAAIDITQESLDAPGVIRALERTGWCQSQPDTDPGHFSFDGCH